MSIETTTSCLVIKTGVEKSRWTVPVKGQFNKIFGYDFYRNGFHSNLSLCIWRLFKFGFKFKEIFAIFDWLSAIFFIVELILPVLFTKESCDSSHHLHRGVTNVWICAETLACPLIWGNQYSTYCLIRRVTTPRIVYSGESLTTAGESCGKLDTFPD
jgi:hypothetical protein